MEYTDLIRMTSEILPFVISGILGGLFTYLCQGYITHRFELRGLGRAHDQRIIEMMTEKFHGYIENYYMSIASSSSHLAGQIMRISPCNYEDEQRLTFYFFALFLSQRANMLSKINGIFLKDSISEKILPSLLDKIFEIISEHLPHADLSKIAKETNPSETFIDFSEKLNNNQLLFQNFQNFIKESCINFKKYKYLFSWNEIPGRDNNKLIDSLEQEYNIYPIEEESINITKPNGKTIEVSTGKNSLSLKYNDKESKVGLKINDGRTGEFIVKNEDGELNIYKFKNCSNGCSKLCAYLNCFSDLLIDEINESYVAWYERHCYYTTPDDKEILKMIIEENENKNNIDSSEADRFKKKYKLTNSGLTRLKCYFQYR